MNHIQTAGVQIIAVACILFYHTGLHANQSDDLPPESNRMLLFNSGFEPDSEIRHLGDPFAGSDKIVGRDRSVSSPNDWLVDIDNSDQLGFFSLQYQGGDTTKRVARIIPEPGNPGNHVLMFRINEPWVNQQGNPLARVQANIYDSYPQSKMMAIRELYQSVRLFIHEDMDILKMYPRPINWLTIFEFWNNLTWEDDPHPFRITVGIGKPDAETGELYFMADAEDYDYVTGRHLIWHEMETEVPVPTGTWMTMEVYMREGNDRTGRFYMAMTPEGGDKKVIFDIRGFTHNANDPDPDGLKLWNPMKLYTSAHLANYVSENDRSLQVYWDDLAIWKYLPDQEAAELAMMAMEEEIPERKRAEQLGVHIGMLPAGPLNMITDVPGVKVGHATRIEGDHIRTGVTAILPHGGNLFRQKVPGAIYNFNSFGKMAGSLQVDELGNIETPIVLTNTLSVGTAVEATAAWVLAQEGNEDVRSVNALVGETNDGYLNDIRGQHVTKEDVFRAIESATPGEVAEGNVGAGTGTRSFGYKSGIGTASRVTTPIGGQEYTVGVLVQSNFGRDLYINGVPFTREIARIERLKLDQLKGGGMEGREPARNRLDGDYPATADGITEMRDYLEEDDGSAMIIIATDAPLSYRNLRRMAKRSFVGMGRTVGYMSNFSGDFAIAFSTAYTIPPGGMRLVDPAPALIGNNEMNPLFQAVEEATREAIYNALFMSESMMGRDGNQMDAIPLDKVIEILDRYNMRHLNNRFSDDQ